MKPSIEQQLASTCARLDAAFSNLNFASNRAAEAMQDFRFAVEAANQTDLAVRANEIAEASILRASSTT